MKKHITLVIVILLQIISVKAQIVTGIVIDSNGVRLGGLTVQFYSIGKVVSNTSYIDGTFSLNIPSAVKNENLVNGYAISNNYPNPFNPRTRIEFALPKASNIKAEIYNITGQKVRDVIEANFSSGSNYLDIELNGLPNGLYFARIIIDGSYVVTKKLMLLYGSQHLSTIKISGAANIRKVNKDIFIDSLIISGSYIEKTKINPPTHTTGNELNLGKIKVKLLAEPAYTPCHGIPTVTYSGKSYNTVQIGSQCWLKENLDIGAMIQGTQEQTDNNVIEKYCFLNDSSYCAGYGGLYQWAEAMQYISGVTNTNLPNSPLLGNVRGICPKGWHIPSKYELYDSLVGKYKPDSEGLQTAGQGINTGGNTNKSGFSALLAGLKSYNDQKFYACGLETFFWSSSGYTTNYASAVYLADDVYNGDGVDSYSKSYGFSVRCLKD